MFRTLHCVYLKRCLTCFLFFLLTAYVVSPSGKKVYPKIKDNNDGTVTILNQPTETGLHEIHANYNNQKIQGNELVSSAKKIIEDILNIYEKRQ